MKGRRYEPGEDGDYALSRSRPLIRSLNLIGISSGTGSFVTDSSEVNKAYTGWRLPRIWN